MDTLDNLNEEEKIKELERMNELVCSNYRLLRKNYSIKSLEYLLEKVKSDEAYISNFTKQYEECYLSNIKFELNSEVDWIFLEEAEDTPWWKFWKRKFEEVWNIGGDR